MSFHTGHTRHQVDHVLKKATDQIIPMINNAADVLHDKASKVAENLQKLFSTILEQGIHGAKKMKIVSTPTFTDALDAIFEWVKNNVSRSLVGDLIDSIMANIRPLMQSTKFKSTVFQVAI